jgi:outer membrane protein assembly factor BamB
VKGSPIATGNFVFFGSDDTYFYCLHQETGQVLWKVKTGGAIRGVPMFYVDEKDLVIREVLFVSFDNFLYDVKIKDGTRKWLAPVGARVFNKMYYDRALIFIAPFGGSVAGYDPHTGARVGDFNTKNRVRSSPVTDNDRLFIGLNNGNLLCLTRMPPPPPEGEEGEGAQTSPAATQTAAVQTEENLEGQTQQTQTQSQ